MFYALRLELPSGNMISAWNLHVYILIKIKCVAEQISKKFLTNQVHNFFVSDLLVIVGCGLSIKYNLQPRHAS